MGTVPSISEAEKHWLRELSTLNELQARLFVAQQALELGRGGVSQVSRRPVCHVRRSTAASRNCVVIGKVIPPMGGIESAGRAEDENRWRWQTRKFRDACGGFWRNHGGKSHEFAEMDGQVHAHHGG